MSDEPMIMTISPRELLVYLCLRKHMNSTTGKAVVTVSEIHKQTSASPVTVLKCLDNLKTKKFISSTKRGRENVYVFEKQIDAKSYSFLREDIPLAQKESMAVEMAVFDTGNEQIDKPTNRLYDYVVQLEEKVTDMNTTINMLVSEINKLIRDNSILLGKEYKPINIE